MMRQCTMFLAGVFVCLASRSGVAAHLGDPVPPLTVSEWVEGQPVDVRDGKNIYVVQFCTLSRTSDIGLTNLSALQTKFKDKGVVAVAVSDDPPAELRGFVKQRGAQIAYRVAADEDRRATLSYLASFEQMSLPHAFVVGKNGKLLWHGHPLRGLEQILDEITTGRYSLEQTRQAELAGKLLEEYLNLARANNAKAAAAGQTVLASRTNNVAQLCELAFQIAAGAQLPQPDFALAAEALAQAEKLAPNSFSVALNRAILLFQTGRKQEALARAREAMSLAKTADEKSDAENCLRTIQKRMEGGK